MKKPCWVLSLSIIVLFVTISICSAAVYRVTQLTDNSHGDGAAWVSGSNVVWAGWDGSDYEIFLATPEPCTLALLGMAAVGLLAWAWRRRRRTA